MRAILHLLTIALAILLPLGAWASAADEPEKATITAMGGIPINVSAWDISRGDFNTAVNEISARIEFLEAMISTYRPDSVVSQLNEGRRAEEIPPELAYLVFMSTAISQDTAGAFDITVKPLVNLWRTCRKEQRLPTDTERLAALNKVGYEHIVSGIDGSITFTKPGVMLDLGGIAKGYFSDEAVTILRNAGATRCLVDCGGDITSWQADTAAGPFRVGIKNPLEKAELFAVLSVPTGAVVTSGDYERFYEIDGKRFCHIFDPRSGYPVEGVLSVTLVAPTGIQADAYATGVFVLGFDTGAQFVERLSDLEAVIIGRTADGELKVFVSSGLADSLEYLDAE